MASKAEVRSMIADLLAGSLNDSPEDYPDLLREMGDASYERADLIERGTPILAIEYDDEVL